MQRCITFPQAIITLGYFTRISIAGAILLAICVIPSNAQLQDWVNSQPNPNPAPAIIDIAYPLGRAGVGILYPQTMLHVHSLQEITPIGNVLGTHYPAILRLQTQHNLGDALTGIDGNKFGQSEIQFWSNSDYRPTIGTNQFVPNKWQVASIKSINVDNGDPILTQTEGTYRGGLAFYCSGSSTYGDAQQQIEVMRIVDKRVGIKTLLPYSNSLLDVRGTISTGGLDEGTNIRMPGTVSFNPKNNFDNYYHIDNYGVNFPGNPAITYGSQLRFSAGGIPGGGPLGSEGTMMVMESYGGSVGVGNHLTKLGGTMSSHKLNLNGPKGTLSILRNPDRAGVAPVALRIEQAPTSYEYWWESPLISAGVESKTSFEVFAGGQVHIGQRDAANLNSAGIFGLMKWQKSVNGSMVSTENPHVWDAKLVVKGKAVVQELFVTTTADYWADFVFDDSYKLMPLEDVESHIKSNHHLPNIPSAKQISENGGSSVGDMQVKLLQKVEELTLYIIEMKKENTELRSKMTSLQLQINTK
ncbi:MAG: hypothetical protein IPM69_06075 [Ignavibacteria bacterium]|nr:hypothetical protein [Ignavibacteria bacterium]